MKIRAIDQNCWVSIEYRRDPNGYSGYEVIAFADVRHGLFSSKNIDVQFLNLAEFVEEFDRFILERSRHPRLEGTYDTFIAFSASGTMVMCTYRLGDAFCGKKTVYFQQTGEFEIQQENLMPLLADFREILEARQGAAKGL